MPPPWTAQEEQLLAAIVFEFGANWGLVSDILSSTTGLCGIYRRPDACRERFRLTQVPGRACTGGLFRLAAAEAYSGKSCRVVVVSFSCVSRHTWIDRTQIFL